MSGNIGANSGYSIVFVEVEVGALLLICLHCKFDQARKACIQMRVGE